MEASSARYPRARAMSSEPSPSPPATICLTIKNLTKRDFTLGEVPLALTVGELKTQIESEYEGNPPPNTQRIVYAGALLRDESAGLADVVKASDLEQAAVVFHLVLPAEASSTTSTPASTPGVTPVQNAGQSDTPVSTAPPATERAAPWTPPPAAPPAPREDHPFAGYRYPSPPARNRPTQQPTPTQTPPQTPQPVYPPPYAGLGAHSPHVQAVYASAYAAAFNALSPGGTPAPGAPVAVPVPVPVFGFGGWPGATGWPPHGYGVPGYTGAPGQHAAYGQHAVVAPAAPAVRGFDLNDPDDAARAVAQAVRDGDPVAAAAAAAAAAAGGRPVHVMQIHIDLRLIMKLAFVVAIASQGATHVRIGIYVAAAIVVYLFQTGAVTALLRRFAPDMVDDGAAGGMAAGGVAGVGAGAADAAGAAGPPARRRPPPGPRTNAVLPGMRDGMPRSWVGEIKVLVCGFLASLLPSWQPPELHRHPRPGAAVVAAAAGGERPHQD